MVCGKTSLNRILCGFRARLEKFSLTFSIRPLQSELILPSLTILVPLWFIIIFLVFFDLNKLLFSGFL